MSPAERKALKQILSIKAGKMLSKVLKSDGKDYLHDRLYGRLLAWAAIFELSYWLGQTDDEINEHMANLDKAIDRMIAGFEETHGED